MKKKSRSRKVAVEERPAGSSWDHSTAKRIFGKFTAGFPQNERKLVFGKLRKFWVMQLNPKRVEREFLGTRGQIPTWAINLHGSACVVLAVLGSALVPGLGQVWDNLWALSVERRLLEHLIHWKLYDISAAVIVAGIFVKAFARLGAGCTTAGPRGAVRDGFVVSFGTHFLFLSSALALVACIASSHILPEWVRLAISGLIMSGVAGFCYLHGRATFFSATKDIGGGNNRSIGKNRAACLGGVTTMMAFAALPLSARIVGAAQRDFELSCSTTQLFSPNCSANIGKNNTEAKSTIAVVLTNHSGQTFFIPQPVASVWIACGNRTLICQAHLAHDNLPLPPMASIAAGNSVGLTMVIDHKEFGIRKYMNARGSGPQLTCGEKDWDAFIATANEPSLRDILQLCIVVRNKDSKDRPIMIHVER